MFLGIRLGMNRRDLPLEICERALSMVEEHRGDCPSLWASIESIAPKAGCVPKTLIEWIKPDELDNGVWEGVTISEAQRIKEINAG